MYQCPTEPKQSKVGHLEILCVNWRKKAASLQNTAYTISTKISYTVSFAVCIGESIQYYKVSLKTLYSADYNSFSNLFLVYIRTNDHFNLLLVNIL